MITTEQVYEVLRNCYDPEIPVNLVDLGLIYDVKVDDDNVTVVMTLTARGCPAHSFISEQVREQVARIEGVKSANVQVVWDPPWNISRLSEAARKQLGIGNREQKTEGKPLAMVQSHWDLIVWQRC